jgi:hypothetical protein
MSALSLVPDAVGVRENRSPLYPAPAANAVLPTVKACPNDRLNGVTCLQRWAVASPKIPYDRVELIVRSRLAGVRNTVPQFRHQ